MIIGQRIRAIRESKNLTQGEIEKRTGLLRCYISRVENGYTVPVVATLEKFARALEVHMAALFVEKKCLFTKRRHGFAYQQAETVAVSRGGVGGG